MLTQEPKSICYIFNPQFSIDYIYIYIYINISGFKKLNHINNKNT